MHRHAFQTSVFNRPPVRVIAWLVSAILLAAMLPAELIQPAAAQTDGLTYSVTVQKFECLPQEGFDPYNSDLNTLLSMCTEPHGGVPFTLSTDNPDYAGGGRNTGDDGGSQASWAGIPLGSAFTLQEQIPTGYGLPLIGCLAYTELWNASGGAANPGFSFGEGSVSATVPEAYSATPYIGCYWFNVPLAQNGEGTDTESEDGGAGDGQGGRITIRKYTCWLPGAVTESDPDEIYEDLLNDCTPGYPGVQFRFSGMGDQTFSPQEGGEIRIDNYPGGTLEITELQPHWPHPVLGIAYCSTTDPNGQTSPVQWTALFGGNSVSVETAAGHSVTCDWFNIFVSSVIVVKYTCPDDQDYREPDLDELLPACQLSNGIGFSLTQESGPQGDESQTGQGGIAQWALDHSGAEDDYETTIEELDPGDYRYRRIYCTTAMPGAYPVVTYAAVTEETSITYDHPDGAQVACAWFNVSEYFGENGEGAVDDGTAVEDGEGDVGPVLLRKYVCDDVYPINGAWGDWQSACSANTSVSGFDFGLTNGSTYEDSATTDEGGIAGWAEAPSGPLTLSESETPGYRTGAVFCGTAQQGEPTSFDPVTVSGNSVDLERQVGYIVACLWFNVPSGAGNGLGTGNSYVYVNKYVCAGEYPESQDVDEWLNACANNANGAGFGYLLTDGDQYSETEETDGAGQAVWTPAPAGQLFLTETDPLGYRTGAVFCGTDVYTSDPVVGVWHEVENGDTVTFDHQDGYITQCYWFNVQDRPVTIILYKYLCEPGYDDTSLSKEYLESYCAPEEDVSFYAEGPEGAGGTGVSDEDGFMTWDDVPAGSWSVSEDERAGYRPLKAYCALVSVPNGEPPYVESEILGWQMSYHVPAGATLTCYWFNQRYEEVGKVRFHKYVCDSGLDETSLGYDYLLSYCTEPHESVRYDVTWSDGSSDWQETDENGYAEWDDVPIGPFSAYENVPTGYRLVRVYCNHYMESQGPAPDEWNNVMQGTNQMAWGNLWDAYVLECYWFNVEYEDTGYGSVTIYKYACPEGYDPSNTTPGYLAAYCGEAPHVDVDFELARESDPARGGTTGDDGSVYWPDVQDGALVITEVLPPGYITVYIECAAYPRHAAPGMYEGVSFYEGRTMNYHLQEGYSLTCYWYDAPYVDEYGTVTIYKYTCSEGYEHDSLSKSYLDSYCSEPYEGVDYDLYYEQDDPITMTTSDSGEAFWEEVYGGSLQLYEHVPEGYYVLRVYCTAYPASGAPGEYMEMPVYDGTSVYYDLPPGYSLICYWYNTPVAGGWIEITKYACPAGYDPSHATAHDYEYACQQRIEGVEYFLDRHGEESESESGETDSSGYLRFEPLEYGASYDVVETYPDGYDAAVVYCTRYTPHWGGEGPWERYAVYNGAISIQLHEGEYLRCRWYNLESEYGVNIHVTKYACHEDAWEYSRDELFAGCEEWMSNVRFYVNVGYDRISGLTSTAGEVAWEGVPAGLIRIEETPPEGYGNRVRVYCRVMQGDQVGEWQSANVYDGIAIEYGMAAGNTLDCSWYNFPVDDTGASVTVYKYHCHATAGSYSTSLHSMKSKCVPLAGMRLTLAAPGQQGVSRITGEEGIAAWQGVPTGDIAIGEQYVYGYGTPVVYCSVGSESSERVFSGGGSIEYELEEGDALRCDWFNISEVSTSGTGSSQGGGVVIINNSSSSSSSSTSGGIFGGAITTPGGQQPGTTTPGGTQQQGAGPATLTIIKYVCPSSIDLEDPASQPSADCESTDEPVSFNLRVWDDPTDGDGTTSQSAPPNVDTVTFSNLEADEYILTELPAEDADIAWAFVLSCESSLGATDSTRFYPLAMTRDNLSLHLTLYAGERLTCHWYNVPGGGTSVSVTVYECPGAVANPSQCVIASAPHTILFTPAGPAGEASEATTGPTGTAEAELSNGTYEVDDAGANACLIDSNALDDSNNLAIDGSMPVEVVIYTCAA